MHKKFEMNLTKIKGGYQPGIKVVTHNSKSDLPLVEKTLLINRNRYMVHTYSVNEPSRRSK